MFVGDVSLGCKSVVPKYKITIVDVGRSKCGIDGSYYQLFIFRDLLSDDLVDLYALPFREFLRGALRVS